MASPSAPQTKIKIESESKKGYLYQEELGSGVLLDMVLIQGGTFSMGSPETEPERFDNEGPQHEVIVPSFAIGRYPITQAQWKAVAALPQIEIELNPEPSHFKGENRPVEQISWYDAKEFCARLADKTKRPYRLPTESEWEYACRAGTETPFHFGETITTDLVNYNGSPYNGGLQGKGRGETTLVDTFEHSNAFGLHDMHGNVWEWCEDHWHGDYNGAPTDGKAWFAGKKDANRVLRGGSWDYSPRYCRSALRDPDSPDLRYGHLGLRVVCSLLRT
jgi:formylglycine-generating enzyme required for sulfatase activity